MQTGPLDPLKLAHLNFVGRLHLDVAVCVDYLEHADKALTFELDEPPIRADLNSTARKNVQSGLTLR